MHRRILSYITHDGFGSSLFRALAGSAGLRIVGMCFGMLVGVQLARGLGAEGYGLYGLAVSIISIVAIPVEFGLPQLLIREVAVAQVRSNWGIVHAILGWAFRIVWLMAIGTLVVGLLIFLLRPNFIDISLMNALGAGSLFILFAPIGNVCGAALRGLQKIVAGQISEIVLRPVFHSGLLFVGVFMLPGGLTPNIALALQAVSVGGATAIAYVYLRRIIPRGAIRAITSIEKRKWLKSSGSLALTEAMRIVHGNITIIILGLMVSASIVGVFRVGSSMSALIMMPVSLIHIVLSPIFARIYSNGDMEKIQELAGWASFSMAMGTLVFLVPFIFWGNQLLVMAFGPDFSGANGTLFIISLGYIVGSMFGPGATILNMTGNENIVTRSFGFSLALQCGLIVPLIYQFGAEGAALANAIAFVFWSALMWYGSFKIFGVDTSIFVCFKRLYIFFRLIINHKI